MAAAEPGDWISTGDVHTHLRLRNYRKPALQRYLKKNQKLIVMVPLYAISSLIFLFSLEGIYCFFVLPLSYLGGEWSMLIMLHGRPLKAPVFPVNYLQVKPVLAIAPLILKAVGKFNEGSFRFNSTLLFLYCLAVFWMCVNDDFKLFRPAPKYLCVKGILFLSFWQALFILILVSAGVVTHLGPYTSEEDRDKIMPLFAIPHAYVFAYTDLIDPYTTYAALMPLYYALRDAFGLRGEGMDYRTFEPSERYIHQGDRQAVGRHACAAAGRAGGERDAPRSRPHDEATGSTNSRTGTGRLSGPGRAGHGRQELFEHSRQFMFRDYNYPTVDMRSEHARTPIWDEEERGQRDERGASFSPIRGVPGNQALEAR
ncbi:organic solute transporter Ostalpha-domain-containing protein [Mycena polygramma]|nr:organic solute transporter Ostalpha-domain-containing protein [Mycena polygramma]